MISRRALLASALFVPIAACNSSGNINTQLVSTVLQDAQAIASGFRSALTQLTSLPNSTIPADVLNTAQSALAGIQGVVASLVGATDVASAQPFVQQLWTFVNTFVAAMAPFMPPPINTYLVAATVLLPVIESAVNLALPPVTAPQLPAPTTTSPDAARAKLTS